MIHLLPRPSAPVFLLKTKLAGINFKQTAFELNRDRVVIYILCQCHHVIVMSCCVTILYYRILITNPACRPKLITKLWSVFREDCHIFRSSKLS